MTTIIERPTDSSAFVLMLAVMTIAILAGLGLYTLRLFPFNTETRADNPVTIRVNGQQPSPVVPSPAQ